MKEKNFSIFKNKEPNDNPNFPTHFISAKVGEGFKQIGNCWRKENQYGQYLSCSFNSEWVSEKDKTKSKRGYHIEEDIKRDEGEVHPSEIPDVDF